MLEELHDSPLEAESQNEQIGAPDGDVTPAPDSPPEPPDPSDFMDGQYVAPGLEDAYEKMRAQWTRKNMAASESVKETEALLAQVAEASKLKADADNWRRSVVDPQFRRQYLAAMDAIQPGPTIGSNQPVQIRKFYDTGDTVLESKQSNVVKQHAMEAFAEHVIPEIKPLVDRLNQVEAILGQMTYQTAAQGYEGADEKVMGEVINFLSENKNAFANLPPKERIAKVLPLFIEKKPAQVAPKPSPAPKPGTNGRDNGARVAAQVARPATTGGPRQPGGRSLTFHELVNKRADEMGLR